MSTETPQRDAEPAAAASGGEDTLSISRRKGVFGLVAAIVLVAAAIALLGRVAEFGEMLDVVRKADKRWFALCLLGQVLAYVGYIAAAAAAVWLLVAQFGDVPLAMAVGRLRVVAV